MIPPLSYPATRHDDICDTYHGTEVADPFRWLEDPTSPATRDWVAEQSRLTSSFLAAVPGREGLRARARALLDYERLDVPFRAGDRYFYFRNPGLDRQSTLFTTKSWSEPPRVLLDPRTFAEDGSVAVADLSVSADGRWLAYALSSGGSDWLTWRIHDVEVGCDLEDAVEWAKFSRAAWTKDAAGFFYGAYDPPRDSDARLTEPNYNQKIYYHRRGSSQSDDRLVYARPDHPEWGFTPEVSDDGRYLILSVWKGTHRRNQILYLDLDTPEAVMTEFLVGFDALYEVIGNRGSRFFLRTDRGASRSRVVAIDLERAHQEHWVEVISESAATLEGASLFGDHIVACYIEDACSLVRVFNLDGTIAGDVTLPGPGSVTGLHGREDHDETFFSFSSFTSPAVIYRLVPSTRVTEVVRTPRVAFDPAEFDTRQVFYPSKDGTRIPMFVSHKKGLDRSGESPTFLYGYGGFRISLTPAFSVASLLWMEMGGIYAVPNLRGGGEYGDEWHQAGTILRKQNVFDDFIAAGEWLVAEGYTLASRLAIGGGSNGGLLVGACLLQRPDLFAAAIAANGVLDMLRYHRWTIGWAWSSDYGTADNEAEFRALLAYSPVHNATPGNYPATLVTTADHDDRVVPAHSYKFVAALQAAQSEPKPILLRVDARVGHGLGKPTDKLIAEIVDRWSFLSAALGGLNLPPA